MRSPAALGRRQYGGTQMKEQKPVRALGWFSIGLGLTEVTAKRDAALWNGYLVRYLDFMDNFAAPAEVCHPSDNFAALLAAAEYTDRTGEELLVALAVA